MGRIPSVSLPPEKTCPADAPCRKGGCYSKKLCKIRPRLLATLEGNLRYYNGDPDNYFSKITSYLDYANTNFFRWDVHGDFPSEDYFARIKYIAKKTPTIKHLAFTKRYDYNFLKLPANFSVVFSMWNNYGNTRKKMPRAWMLDPKDPDPRIPLNALSCPGNCETCGACWNLKLINRDMTLPKH